MDNEDMLDDPNQETETALSPGVRGSFVSGLVLGIVVGAGVALLFAPAQGEKTRGRLRKQMRSFKADAREGLDRAGSRTRDELLRRQRQLRDELRRVKARAREALD